MTHGQVLDDLEQRLNALEAQGAYSVTLYSADLAWFGIPTTHKKRRYIAWTRRKIEQQRSKIAAAVAAKLTGT
jgi:hypothetical protein